MKNKMICFALLICTLAACQNFKSSTDVGGETVQRTGTIRLTKSTNTCLEGFNNYRIDDDSSSVAICAMKGPKNLAAECLPEPQNKDGLRVRFSGIFYPPPSNVKMDCRIMVLKNIEPLNEKGALK